jgi:hypothetical protein
LGVIDLANDQKDAIRVRFGVLEGLINETDSGHHQRRAVVQQESHIEHCFDYIRQVRVFDYFITTLHGVK